MSASSANIQDVIHQIHDLTIEKSHVINDKNYRRYLPRKHKILRSIYQAWVFLVVFSVLPFVLNFYAPSDAMRAFAFNAMLAIFLYSLFVLLVTLGLFAAAYTVPIAVTNEVKAKLVMKFNRRLDALKETLQKSFTRAIIENSLHEGRFNLKDIKGSVMKFVETGFPGVQYIKEIVTDEIIKPVEHEVGDYIAEMANVLMGKVKSNAVKIQQVAENTGTKSEFIVLMLKWMLESGTIDGALTEFDLEFVPAGIMTPSTQHAQYPAIPVDGPILQAAPNASQSAGAQGQAKSVVVESSGHAGIPSIDGVKLRIEEKRQEIDAAKKAFEKGEIGIDAYVSKSEVLENELSFLKHRMVLLERVQDPTKTCLSCFKPVDDGANTIKCSNDHVFHLDCAQAWLSKHEECPWCMEKISSIAAMQDL
nr:RING finger protein [Candidatus Sigynarchaeota archaeon]